MHKNIMILGTASSAGKSLITTALCRVFYEDGNRVTPFKSQNMSLNSFVTEEGLEMGRAQVVQAEASMIKPKVFMNPILLKPNSNNGSQIIFMGKSLGNMNAADYFKFRINLKEKIQDIYENIRKDFDICVIEGAGSPAEINLNKDDLVNIGMAKIAKSPCILVADIDKGGVFASIYGTIMLLSLEERSYIKGIIINKFRGDIKLLDSGLKMIEDLVKIPVLGVLPYFNHNIEEEDSANEDSFKKIKKGKIKVSVIKLPHMSNFNDFDPFKLNDSCTLEFIEKSENLKNPHILIIPGSKNTISDFLFLKNNGFIEKIHKLQKKGILILGICGGMQILGKSIKDPFSIESNHKKIKGFGLLKIKTVLEPEKTTKQFEGFTKKDILNIDSNFKLSGYEIHQGVSVGKGGFLKSNGKDIAFFNDNVLGTYLHGIFDDGIFLSKLLQWVSEKNALKIDFKTADFNKRKEIEYQNLAKVFRNSVDMKKIYEIMDDFNVN